MPPTEHPLIQDGLRALGVEKFQLVAIKAALFLLLEGRGNIVRGRCNTARGVSQDCRCQSTTKHADRLRLRRPPSIGSVEDAARIGLEPIECLEVDNAGRRQSEIAP